jgi:23S rRNA pseudouridine2605 synthase
MTADSSQESREGRERLNRFLARAGVASRRAADEIIRAGRVSINGNVVTQMATFVDPESDKVAVDGNVLEPPPEETIWIVLNKAAGTVTTRSDTHGRPTIYDGLPSVYNNLITVGRLDMDTEGVLLLTNDGDAANKLMHPRHQIERVYEAEVEGVPSSGSLRQMYDGIDLGDPTPARAEAVITARKAQGAVLRLVLREGRKREIKRLCEAIGHPVRKLKRVSYAGIRVGRIGRGKWRKLSPHEIAKIETVIKKS